MTITRSAIPATTPRSWVMIISDAPILSRAARSASSTWAWMVTSRAVVGSSAIITSGSLAIAIAITIRCRWPPENSCGKSSTRRARVRDPDELEQLDGLLVRFFLVHVAAGPDGLGDLPAHGEGGVERGQRILRDVGDRAAADLREILFRLPDQLLALAADRAGDARAARQQAKHRERDGGLARPGLAHDPDGLAATEGEAHATDGPHVAVVRREGHRQVGSRKHGRVSGRNVVGHVSAPVGSGRGRPAGRRR